MNIVVTSREAILETSRRLMMEQGWPAVNIRTVAAACGVSVGSIYNYFASKSDLVTATVESIWRDIFHFSERGVEFAHFSDCVHWIFDSIKKGSENYPGFFSAHSMLVSGDDRTGGQQLMAQSWTHIQSELLSVLEQDNDIRSDAFDRTLTPQKFVDIVFSLILSALLRQNYDDSGILELIRRAVY